ncbi:MAG: hypothetical protein Q8876_09335 [Bacillota bacterium]|nr:hypothetical protein [Bacillota bacterium]
MPKKVNIDMPSFLTRTVFKGTCANQAYTLNYMHSKSANCKKTLAKGTLV